MDLSNHVGYNSVFAYVLVAGTLIVVIVLWAAGAKDKIRMAIAGISISVILLSAIFLWSDGSVGLPLIEEVKAAFSASSAAAANAAQHTEINIPVSEQAPPTIVLQGNDTSASSSGETTPEVAPAESETDVTSSDRTEIFDLGSQVAGHFPDGVAYRLHTIQPGETIFSIRRHYGLTERELLDRNGLDIRRPIIAGRTLKIPLL